MKALHATLLIAPHSVLAWWDQGHMLVAAVAELALSGELLNDTRTVFPWTPQGGRLSLSRISQVLRAWDADYPDFSNLISAATWADHIKCIQRSDFCGTNRRFDGIELFNHDHFIDLKYGEGVNNQSTRTDLNRLLHVNGNALWLLSDAARSLSNALKVLGDRDRSFEEVTALSRADLTRALILSAREKADESKNRHNTLTSAPGSVGEQEFAEDVGEQHGTAFSYNLLMRLFIHVFGDIHQPLHTMTYVEPQCFPHGDRGGNAIPVHVPAAIAPTKDARATNLHALWDSGGQVLTSSYPLYSIDQARAQARELAARFPPGNDGLGFHTDLRTFVAASHELGSLVYSEISRLGDCPSASKPYVPSEAYLKAVQEMSARRIVEAGYNLACFLKIFTNEIPLSLTEQLEASDVSRLRLAATFWKFWAVLSTTIVAFMGATKVMTTWARRRELEEFRYWLKEPLSQSSLKTGDDCDARRSCSVTGDAGSTCSVKFSRRPFDGTM